MVSRLHLDWATFFVVLLLWQHMGCYAKPTTLLLPHLAGALGGSVKVTIEGSTAASSQPRMSDAEVAQWRSCTKSVATNDPGMRAITKMLSVVYTCASIDRAGCRSMVQAQKVPFTSASYMKAALENAAKQVSSCVASNGRGLRAWGADMLDGTFDVSLHDIKRMCAASTGIDTLDHQSFNDPENSHLDLGTKILAGVAGFARSLLSAKVAEVSGSPSLAWTVDDKIGWLFIQLYETNKAACFSYFGEVAGVNTGCNELRDMAVDKAVQAWAQSAECKQCGANRGARCLEIVANLNKEFSDMMDSTNMLSSLFGNLKNFYKMYNKFGDMWFQKGGKEAANEVLDSLWNVYSFLREEYNWLNSLPVPPKPIQPPETTTTSAATDDQQTHAPSTGILSGLTQAKQNEGRNCAAVVGTYQLSAKHWVADKSNKDNKQCQKSQSITIFPDCQLHLKDESGYESKYHIYIPGTPIGCGEVEFSKDWQRKVHWDMRQALSGGLSLFCVDESRKILGEWYYSIPSWWNKCTPTPSGAANQARAYCTNIVDKNDGCRGGERVWCCAGVIGTSQIQMPCALLGPAGTNSLCPASGTPMRYCCPFTQNPGPLTEPVATTTTPASPPAPRSDSYTVDGTAYALCPCKAPCNAPVGGGQGVRLTGTNDCVNCGSYPCPQGMTCKPGAASPMQAPSEAFATCV